MSFVSRTDVLGQLNQHRRWQIFIISEDLKLSGVAPHPKIKA
jgi:hypothetical protein